MTVCNISFFYLAENFLQHLNLSFFTFVLIVVTVDCVLLDKHYWCYGSWQKCSAVWYSRFSTTPQGYFWLSNFCISCSFCLLAETGDCQLLKVYLNIFRRFHFCLLAIVAGLNTIDHSIIVGQISLDFGIGLHDCPKLLPVLYPIECINMP